MNRYNWVSLDGESYRVPTEDLILGMRYFLDATMPPDTVEFRDSTGRLVGRIVNLDVPETEGDAK
jgi:hypothetical protein